VSLVQSPSELVEFVLSETEKATRTFDRMRKGRIERDPVQRKSQPEVPVDQGEWSQPSWLYEIPASVRPGEAIATKLEDLRQEAQIPHRVFANMVLQSPGLTKILVERQFRDFRRRRPVATDKELFTSILRFRYFTTDLADGMTPEDSRELLRQPWRESIIAAVVQSIDTIDDLAHYIADEYEEFWERTSDPLGVNSKIAQILGYRRQP
jgi:hypothetical protein